MHVRILELEGGLDPDEYCKERGAEAYRASWTRRRPTFTGWRTGRARNSTCARRRGAWRGFQFLLPAIQRPAG